MRDCTEFVELMQRQMDGELSELETKRLEKHIHHCPACAADYQIFQEMNDLLLGVEMVEPPVDLKNMIMAEIMSEVAETVTSEIPGTKEQEVGCHAERQGAKPTETVRRQRASVPVLPVGVMVAMVLAATINGVLFLARLAPFFNAQFSGVERRLITQLLIQSFARFAVVGRHTGEALQKAFQLVILYLPWQLVFTYLIVAVLSILGLIYFLHHGRKGGSLT